MKITHVKHAQKEGLTCRKCGEDIKPSRYENQKVADKRSGKTVTRKVRVLGDSYRWIKFNRGATVIRCSKVDCRFRQSDMTAGKMSQVYAASESAEDTINAWDPTNGVDELKSALEDMAEEIQAVADEYEESASNIEEVFTGGSATADECRSKAEELSSWKDEIETAANDFEEWDGDDDAEEEVDEEAEKEKGPRDREANATKMKTNSSGETWEDWAEGEREKALDAINNCPI